MAGEEKISYNRGMDMDLIEFHNRMLEMMINIKKQDCNDDAYTWHLTDMDWTDEEKKQFDAVLDNRMKLKEVE